MYSVEQLFTSLYQMPLCVRHYAKNQEAHSPRPDETNFWAVYSNKNSEQNKLSRLVD